MTSHPHSSEKEREEVKYQISLLLVERSCRELGCTSEEYGQVYDSEKHEALLNKFMDILAQSHQSAEAALAAKLLEVAKDELAAERRYVNNATNITYYENVVKFLESSYSIRTALNPPKDKV